MILMEEVALVDILALEAQAAATGEVVVATEAVVDLLAMEVGAEVLGNDAQMHFFKNYLLLRIH